jgi:hypothetical protein
MMRGDTAGRERVVSGTCNTVTSARCSYFLDVVMIGRARQKTKGQKCLFFNFR